MSFWTDERITELRGHFDAGLTASEIMREMGAESRETICGKLYRLGLKRGSPKARPDAKPREPRRPRAANPPGPVMFRAPMPSIAPPPAAEPAGAHACDLVGLRNASCRWVVSGDGPPFLYCGEPEADFAGQVPYCRFHAMRAYRRPGEAA